MRVYLVRHAEAVDSPPGARFLDDLRPLSPRGRRRFIRTARAFAKLGETLDVVRASPTLRTVQTAELLVHHLHASPSAVLDELHRDVPAALVRRWLLDQDARSIALVGHGRQLRDLARLLIGHELRLPMKKGAILRIDVRGDAARTRWLLREDEQAVAAWPRTRTAAA
jgi:phosphohistidine phosphatase